MPARRATNSDSNPRTKPMPQPKRSGGKILVDALLAAGVERVFCVPGESYLPVLDALRDARDSIDTIVCRQEGGAAYMADADAKLSGRPGVCFVSRGPGAANAMIGIHTAFQDSTPLLLFIGQIPRAEMGREAFQELDYKRVYAGVAKQVIRIDSAASMPALVGRAWRAAVTGRPGPVVVELPEDVLSEESTVEDSAPAMWTPPPSSRKPNAATVKRFAAMLRASKRPVVIAGGAAWTPAANDAWPRSPINMQYRWRVLFAAKTCSTTRTRTSSANSASAPIRRCSTWLSAPI